MDEVELKQRTKAFGIRAIKLVESLPHTSVGNVLGKQLLRSATSVGANYRSACTGKSLADFIAKLTIALEEADESIYWMELIVEAKLLPSQQVGALLEEGHEILAILTASHKTAKQHLYQKANQSVREEIEN